MEICLWFEKLQRQTLRQIKVKNGATANAREPKKALNHILKTRNFKVIICFTLSLPATHYL
jgi:hypothetical protein